MIDPVLVSLGGLEIRWYGVMIAIGVLAGFGVQTFRCKRYGMTADHVSDVTFVALMSGVIGARLLYVVRFWEDYFSDGRWVEAFMVWRGGLVFQGGFVLGLVVVVLYVRYRKLNLLDVADLVAPALPLAHGFGRIGCLINKCCYGYTPYEGPFAIYYEPGMPGYFPVQLVEAFGNLLLFGVILLCERFGVARKRLFLLYVIGYAVLRFVDEFFRGDYPEEQVRSGLTPAQVICLWLLPVLVLSFAWLSWRERAKAVEEGQCGMAKQPKEK